MDSFSLLNRLQPQLPPWAYTTYRILAPAATHWRPATCAEVACPAHVQGWMVPVDESTSLGARQAAYIRRSAGRAFVEHHNTTVEVVKGPDGSTRAEMRDAPGITTFAFAAGQRCFEAGDHRIRLDLEEIYLRQGGDWRGNPTGEVLRHRGAGDWVDDFGEHQQQLADQLERG